MLAGCGDSDPRVRNLIGFCLGELGAIDPGRYNFLNSQLGAVKITTDRILKFLTLFRLDMKSSNHTDDHIKVYNDIDDDNFVVDLVCGLSRGFLGAVDTRTQVLYCRRQLICRQRHASNER